jgi:hypothetical protein
MNLSVPHAFLIIRCISRVYEQSGAANCLTWYTDETGQTEVLSYISATSRSKQSILHRLIGPSHRSVFKTVSEYLFRQDVALLVQ